MIAVSDQTPTSLEDFIGHQSVSLSTNTAEVLWILGQGAADDGSVKFYEKGGGGEGKDIRVWRIGSADDGGSILAEQVSPV